MEKDGQSRTTASSSSDVPWPDLPHPLTELILERLPIQDYARFATVCPKWQSIQKDHRLRGPMIQLPWLCLFPDHGIDPNPTILCCSPFDDDGKFHRFPVPITALGKRPIGSSHGCLILTSSHFSFPSDPKLFSLLNPISGQHLQLPPISGYNKGLGADVAVSSSSSPSNPNFAFMVSTSTHVLVWRMRAPADWIELPRPRIDERSQVVDSTFCGGKFYCLCLCHYDTLLVVDPAPPVPSVEWLNMGWDDDNSLTSMLSPETMRLAYLVECNGELLAVHLVFAIGNGGIQEVKVFKANLVKNVWVRVECLGDWALFIGSNGSFSVLAAAGGRVNMNCIYFNVYSQKIDDLRSRGYPSVWTGYDLGSGRVVHGLPFPSSRMVGCYRWCLLYNSSWIVPSLA